MAFVHGKDTVVQLNSQDLSSFANSTDFSLEADSHDTTTYGKTWHTFFGGLKNGTSSISGIYDNGASSLSPRQILEPLLGTLVDYLFQPEGVGTGKAQSTGRVLITKYAESSPVADMVTWSVEVQFSDTMTSTAQ